MADLYGCSSLGAANVLTGVKPCNVWAVIPTPPPATNQPQPNDSQTIQCAGTLTVTSTSANCSTGFYPAYGLISAEQTSDLIGAIVISVALILVFKFILKLMES